MLDKYIKKIEKYVETNGDIGEDLLIRYVYLDLAKRFSFDPNFQPFGTTKKRKELYIKSCLIEELNKCMESNFVICNSASNVLEYVLRYFGVNIKTVVASNDYRNFPHVYNIIYPKNGGEPYIVDLQEDMYRVQMHGFTVNYGISYKDYRTLVISRLRQEQMDRILGYIDNEHYYTDDYLYLLKSHIGFFEKFDDRVRFVLENIDVFANPNMEYTDRQWYHVRILQSFFDKKEFDYNNNSGKIHFLDCYKDINGVRNFVCCITVQVSNGMDIYIYNKVSGKYCRIKLEHFARAVKNGLVLYNGKVQGLTKVLKSLS